MSTISSCGNRGRSTRAAVRELLGITRALYCAELSADMPFVGQRCGPLAEIGSQHRMAVELPGAGRGGERAWAAWGRGPWRLTGAT